MPRNICQGNIFIHSLKLICGNRTDGLQSFIYHVYTCVYLRLFKTETAQVGWKYFISRPWQKFVLWLPQLRKKSFASINAFPTLRDLADTTLLQRFWGKIVDELWLNWFIASTSVHVFHDYFNQWHNCTSDLLIRKNVQGSDVDLRGSVLLLSLFWESQNDFSSTRDLCVWWLVRC